ncbi:MAG TPA: hypothetical protein VK338_04890, partial [Candidatus Nitrosocosmicus sp.]|nr:hypothetical protein [Candidatus Nitrosocosmicus sp.]
KVNGLNGKFFDVKTINNKSNNPYFEKIAVVKKGDSYHSIVFGFNDKKNQDLFDKILSTFKFTTPEQTSNSNFTKEKLDLYNISINIPPGWSVKEMNRRPEPTASSAYQPKGHDCADYVIQDESRKANLLLKPTCSFGDGGPIEWPDNTDIVKELDSKGKVLLRIFDDRSNNYKYVIGYKPQNGATKGTYGDILSVPFDQSEGQNLIFMSVLLTYSGEASQKENYLKLTDDIIASLRKD